MLVLAICTTFVATVATVLVYAARIMLGRGGLAGIARDRRRRTGGATCRRSASLWCSPCAGAALRLRAFASARCPAMMRAERPLYPLRRTKDEDRAPVAEKNFPCCPLTTSTPFSLASILIFALPHY